MPAPRLPVGSMIAALDVGSSKISCFIGRVLSEDGQMDVVGIGHQASRGIKAGTVIDLDAAEAAIRQTVHAAEHMAAETMRGYPLREVIVNMPALHAHSHAMAVSVQILGQQVTDNDIRRALAKAQDHLPTQDSELIHTIPIAYRLDGKEGITDPRGMVGQTLDVSIHMVTSELAALKNMATCIERSHLDIVSMCLSPYAAGLSALVEDELELGCTVIDMGGGLTSFAVFQGGALLFADAIPIGGQHVTNDIARGLTTSIADAERIKTLYGSAMATSSDERELIDVPLLGEENHTAPNHVPRSLLVGIIQPRLEEIFEHVRARLHDSGVAGAAGRRLVLTGGASQLPGMRDLAQRILDKQVRLGRPLALTGLADSVSGPAFVVTAGLLNYLTQRAHEMPAEIMAHVEHGSVWERVKVWLRENW